MAGIVSLQRLVESIERSYLCGVGLKGGCLGDERGPPDRLPDRDEWQRTCRAVFHRAVYRVLLSGSILAGWHMEPFSSEGVPNRLPPDFPANLQVFLAKYPGTEDDPWEGGLEGEDIAYLERYIPFDQEANSRISQKQDALFGPLGRWLIRSMKENITHVDLEWAQYQRWIDKSDFTSNLNMTNFHDGSIEEGKVILREVMRMLVAYENLTKALMNSGQKYGHGRDWDEEPWGPPVISSDQKVFAIILGVYQMEQVVIADQGWHYASQVGRLPDGCSLGPMPEKAVDIFDLQEYLYRMSGRPNQIDNCEASPPRVQLFTFMLQRYFNLQFQQGHLWTHDKYDDYIGFLADGAIFTNKPMARGIVANFNGSPVYSFYTPRVYQPDFQHLVPALSR